MTTKQLQCLLVYLGYDTGGVDGLHGKKTTEAVRLFQEEYGGLDVDGNAGALTRTALVKAVSEGWTRPKNKPPDTVPNSGTTGTYWDTIKYFKRNEPYIACSCGKCGGFPVEPSEKLMRLADKVRDHFDAEMVPTSTVRCASHNAEVGGSATSRHMSGRAMDYKVRGKTAAQVLEYVKKQTEVHYSYAVNNNVVHMDVD